MLETFTHNLLNIGFLGLDLKEIITWIGVPGVLAIIFAESGLLIGFFLPGDSLLFISGLLIGTYANLVVCCFTSYYSYHWR